MSKTESKIETKIIMVGPSGVGKTSLLAAMYDRIKLEVEALEPPCTFLSSGAVSDELNERLQDLKRLAEGKASTVDLDLGPKPSQEKRVFEFELTVEKVQDPVQFQFIDLPGGWYLGKGDYDEADRLMAQSQVIIVAVDAWALMEPDEDGVVGAYNEEINKPRVICEALQRASVAAAQIAAAETPPRVPSPPLVVFVLVKAEKYLHNDQSDKLVAAAKSCYGPLIQPLIKRNFAIAGCAVETVGGIELISVSEKDVEKDGVKKRRHIGTFARLRKIGYKPVHCSIPLRLAFQMALNNAGGGTAPLSDTWLGGLWERIKVMFIETELSKAMNKHKQLKAVAQHLTTKLSSEPLWWFNGQIRQ